MLKLANWPGGYSAYRDGWFRDQHGARDSEQDGLASPHIAQMILRCSDIKLSMQTCTDISLLDAAEALAALPSLA